MLMRTLWTISSTAPVFALCGALALIPACEPKDGDDTGASTDASTSDDPSSGGSVSASSTNGSSGGTGLTGTGSSGDSSGTSGDSTGTSGTSGDTADDTGDMTSTGTSTNGTSMSSSSTGDTDTDTGNVDPPEPCVGDPKALEFATSMAYLYSQVPPEMTTSGSSSSSGGMDPDPGTLYVKLSSQIFGCKDPNAIVDCGPEWAVTIVIPPEFQTPGSIFNLAGQDVFATFIETGADEGGNMCSFGGGSGGGTFEILDIDANTVKGRLCNVPDFFFTETSPDLDGTFVADRCP